MPLTTIDEGDTESITLTAGQSIDVYPAGVAFLKITSANPDTLARDLRITAPQQIGPFARNVSFDLTAVTDEIQYRSGPSPVSGPILVWDIANDAPPIDNDGRPDGTILLIKELGVMVKVAGVYEPLFYVNVG
jgi:hypothetical protein